MEIKRKVAGILERISPIYYQQLFFIFVFGYVFLMMWDTRTYGSTVRLFPLLIGIPLLGALVLQIVFPLLPDWLAGNFDGLMGAAVGDEEIDLKQDSFERSTRMQRELGVVIWVVALLAIMYLFGFFSGMTVFVAVFIYYYERSLVKAIGIMMINFVLSYILFVQILQLRLFPGAIW